jgi:flagellar biosynthesis protein FlhG
MVDIDDHQRDFIIREIKKISDYVDVIIIDTAAGISANVMRFLSVADEVIVTATPHITSLLDAYGVIKTMHAKHIKTPVNLLVNMARSQVEAKEVFDRIDQCSQQFLDWRINYLGCIKKDLNVDRAIQLRKPLSIAYPHSPASKYIKKIADRLAEKAILKRQGKNQDNFINIFLKGGIKSCNFSI